MKPIKQMKDWNEQAAEDEEESESEKRENSPVKEEADDDTLAFLKNERGKNLLGQEDK